MDSDPKKRERHVYYMMLVQTACAVLGTSVAVFTFISSYFK